MLTEEHIRKLLDRLCVDLGFCLRSSEIERLIDDPPANVIAFTDLVFRSEGLDPKTADRRLYRQVRDMVAYAFEHTGNGGEED